MIYTFQILFDILFPPTEHEKMVRAITLEKIPFLYQPQKINNVISLSDYRRREIQALIASCKFENNFQAARILGALFKIWLDIQSSKRTLVVPIPLSRKRHKERGFNQVEKSLCYAKNLPKDYEINSQILIRIKNTPPQTSLKREERLKNLYGAFMVQKNYSNYLKTFERIIICDDVLTTGTTLNEARAILLPHLLPTTELICLAFSH